MYYRREFAEAGGLIAYANDFAEQFPQAATYVDRILKGAKPEDLPVQAPTKFDLIINLKTAKSLGLDVPFGYAAARRCANRMNDGMSAIDPKRTSPSALHMSAFDPKRTYYRQASRRFVDDLLRRVVDYYGRLEILELGLAPEGGLDSFLKLRPVP